MLAQTGRSSVNNNKSTSAARQSVSLSREDIPAAPGLFFKLFLHLSSLLKYDIHDDMIQYNIMKYSEIEYQYILLSFSLFSSRVCAASIRLVSNTIFQEGMVLTKQID